MEGSDLPDLTAVRHSGTTLARTLIGVGVMEGSVPLDLQIEVHDEWSNVCWSLDFKDAVKVIPPKPATLRTEEILGSLPVRLRYRRA
nr:hypothetical protein [Sphingosinicella flava]